MNRHLKAASAGMGLLALASAGQLVLAGSASAATGNFGTNVAWQPDANSLGNLFFYDAAGHQITSGSTTSTPMAAYYVTGASTTSAYVADTTPEQGNSATWSGTQPITTTQTEPATGLPGDLAGFAGTVVADDSGGSFKGNQIDAFPNNLTATGYQNLYEVRLYANGDNAHWYAADIEIDSPGHWRQVFPVQTTPTVTVSSSAANPATSGASVPLTATLGTALPGKVQFYDGANPIGTPQTVSGTTASYTDAAPATGVHHYTARFIPTPGSTGLGNTSASYDETISAPATTTSIAFVSQTVGAYANDPASVTFQISAADSTHPAGVVTVKDNNSTVLGTATETPAGSGTYVFSTSSLGQGSHQFFGSFAPTSSSYSAPASSASGTAFSYAAPPDTGPADPQNIDTVVPTGIVTITTPYNATNVFHLGTLGLDSTASYLVGSSLFPATGDSPITVTDTRAGGKPWHATVTSGDLTGPGGVKINGQNLGFEAPAVTYPAGNALTGKVTVTGTAPANGVAAGDPGTLGLKGGPTFATTGSNSGVGTAYIRGQLDIKAPTSTPAGTYAGIITFTVIGS